MYQIISFYISSSLTIRFLKSHYILFIETYRILFFVAVNNKYRKKKIKIAEFQGWNSPYTADTSRVKTAAIGLIIPTETAVSPMYRLFR